MTDESSFENPFRTPRPEPPSTAPLNERRDFRPMDAFSFAWEAVRAYPFVVLIVFAGTALETVLPMIGGAVNTVAQQSHSSDARTLGALAYVSAQLVNLPLAAFMTLGITRVCLDVSRGRRPDISRLFETGNYLSALLTLPLVLFGIALALGIPGIGLLGPGVFLLARDHGNPIGMLLFLFGFAIFAALALYVSARLFWIWPSLADGTRGPIAALQRSFELTRGQVLLVVGYFLLSVALSLAAMLLGFCPGLFFGMLVTIPVAVTLMQIASCHGYLCRVGEHPVVPRGA